MGKRLNIVLPETTIRTIDRIVKPGERSRFINQAVQHYVANRSLDVLRARLESAALRDQDIDREVAADWLAVDQQQWQQPDNSKRKPAIRAAGKSTSRRSTRR
jgi:CopG family transcriptional regulator/antitoxin EndoAI